MTVDDVDRVLIVGAGPVGLGAALELARCGVRSVLIEKHDTTSWHPKTRNFNTRTMEIARGWGPAVYERLRGIDTPPGWKSPIRFLRTAIGEELGVIESKGFEGPGPDTSPAWPVIVAGAHRSDPARCRSGERNCRRSVFHGGDEASARRRLG